MPIRGSLRKGRGREASPTGISPHREIMQRHQMFSFPVACLVFAILGVALGLHTRKEGKLGGFTLGLAVDLRLLRDHDRCPRALAQGHGATSPPTGPAGCRTSSSAPSGSRRCWWRAPAGGSELSIPAARAGCAGARQPAEAGASSAALGTGVSSSCSACRDSRSTLPRPRLLDRLRRAHAICASSRSRSSALLGLYYIGDVHRQVRDACSRAQATIGHDARSSSTTRRRSSSPTSCPWRRSSPCWRRSAA